MIERFQAQIQAMQAFSRNQEITANNLANINTPGFKADKLFHRMYQEQVNGETHSQMIPHQHIVLEQGELEPTGNPFDLAIQGNGFFAVEQGDQMLLTRNGRMHLDTNGFLRDDNGAYVLGGEGRIQIPEYFHAIEHQSGDSEWVVAKDGTIRLNGEEFDRIRLVSVEDAGQLERRGGSYFQARQEWLRVHEHTGDLVQGAFEKANVQPLLEMAHMMQTMQMFEAQQRAMRTADEMLSYTAQNLGRF